MSRNSNEKLAVAEARSISKGQWESWWSRRKQWQNRHALRNHLFYKVEMEEGFTLSRQTSSLRFPGSISPTREDAFQASPSIHILHLSQPCHRILFAPHGSYSPNSNPSRRILPAGQWYLNCLHWEAALNMTGSEDTWDLPLDPWVSLFSFWDCFPAWSAYLLVYNSI